MENLIFDPNVYEIKTAEEGGMTVEYRAFEGLPYCAKPLDPIQKLNLFVPEVYYHGGKVNGYDLHTAPIFAPNSVGGYLPGPAEEPGWNKMTKLPNSIFAALHHGYVVVSGGVRGRTSGKVSTEFFAGSSVKMPDGSAATGRMVGRAPAFVVDMKAVIRYLRHNRDVIPGNTERIITNGTSAGGALSALTGATGNCPDYEPYLDEIGAAQERDDIFAASCYCPIHNLENADAAYEWLFSGQNEWFRTKHKKTPEGIIHVPDTGVMTEEEQRVSKDLKKLFPAYVNSLNLEPMKRMAGGTGETGIAAAQRADADTAAEEQRTGAGAGTELAREATLRLDADGNGSFRDYVGRFVTESAQRERDTHWTARTLPQLAAKGSAIEEQEYLKNDADGKAVGLDWNAFAKKVTRMKAAPAFDSLDLKSPENEEFGDETTQARHFSKYSYEHSHVHGEMADERVVALMNPVPHIGADDTAPHFRVRHGVFDRDTSLAIPVILATVLENRGYDVDFRLPWGLPHSGDYDYEELFAWIDSIV